MMSYRRSKDSVAVRCAVSCVFVLTSQFGLAAVARFAEGAVLAGVFGFGRCCKRLLGVKASAPASVILHLLFVWGVYFGVIRRAVSMAMDAVVNMEFGVIIFGMWRIMRSDPGWVAHDSISLRNLESETYAATITGEGESEDIVESERIRHCKSCNVYVKGYDHHCPAFGNCIGQKNHVLFVVLLVLFITTEVSYAACCYQYIITIPTEEKIGLEVLFLAWHTYCICTNIKTDEWINWAKYPEFHQNVQPLPGQVRTTFHNPYNKGVLDNLKEFCNHR